MAGWNTEGSVIVYFEKIIVRLNSISHLEICNVNIALADQMMCLN